jgi:competence protein ComEC
MSFMAMCGLIFILPSLQNLAGRLTGGIPDRFPTLSKIAKFTCDSLAVTLAALAGVLPLTAYYFGIVSFAGAPATLLVLPILAGIIILGSLTAAAGLFLLPLAQVLGWLLWLILSYMLAVVEGFAALPIAYIETGSFSAIYLWIYYFALAILILAINKYKLLKRTDNEDGVDSLPNTLKSGVTKKAQQSIFLSRPFKLILTLILVTGILSSSAIRSVPDDNLHISFLDIGQGDAILIQKGNTQVLVDGGPGAQAVNLALSEKMPFWDRTIELVILTHPHDDHLNGLVEVLKRYRVEHVLTTETGSYLPVYDEWQRFIDEKNISYTLARTGQQIDIDGVIIDVLNPQTTCFEGTGTDVDNNSIVLNIAFGEISFLLTGDMGKYAELELIKDRLITESTVLKVGHHGSRSSTSPEFMNVCNPQIAVISVGEDNEYGHPDTEVIERLIEMVGENNLYRTDRNGTLEFITDGSRLWLKINRW